MEYNLGFKEIQRFLKYKLLANIWKYDKYNIFVIKISYKTGNAKAVNILKLDVFLRVDTKKIFAKIKVQYVE